MPRVMDLNFNQIREQFLPELNQFLAESLSGAASNQGKSHCKEMASYHLETGGKRIRGLIPIYILSKMGADPRKGIPLGAAVEMIHNATLVHDDYQDGDEFRRNRPTVWKKYSGPQAINCGDAMFHYAIGLMAKVPTDSSRLIRLIQKSVEATLAVIEGQAQEFLMKAEPYPGLTRYLEVVQGKTSGLLVLPFVAALEVLGLPEETIQAVGERAQDLGILFQIQDDLLDLYGKKGRDQAATDIAEGKVSALVAIFNDLANKADRERLAEILTKPRDLTGPDEIQDALGLFNQYDVKAKAQDEIQKLTLGISQETRLQDYPQLKGILLEFAEHFSATWTG